MMQDFAKKLDIEILDIPITQHQRLTIYMYKHDYPLETLFNALPI